MLWICPGLPVSYYLKQSVPWVVFMSAYAIIASHLAGWRADVPIEPDQRTKLLLDQLEKFLAHEETTDIEPGDVGEDVQGQQSADR